MKCGWPNDDDAADIGCCVYEPGKPADGKGEGTNGLGEGAIRGVCGRSVPVGVERPGCGWKAGEGRAPRDMVDIPLLRLILRGRPPAWNIPIPVGWEPKEEGKGLLGLAERPVNGFGKDRPLLFGAGTFMGCVVERGANCKGREEFVLGAWSCARSFQRALLECWGC